MRDSLRTRAMMQVLGAAVLWSISGVVARVLFRGVVDPVLLVQVRLTLGGLLLLPVALLSGTGLRIGRFRYSPPTRWRWPRCSSPTSRRSPRPEWPRRFSASTPLHLLVAAYEALRERRLPARPVLFALLAATTGSALLVLSGGGLRIPVAGVVWGLASSVAMAAGTVLAGAAQRSGARPTALLAAGMLVGSLLFVGSRTPWGALAAVPAGDWPFVLYIAVFATAVPFVLYVSAAGRLRGPTVILLAMLEPVLAAALAWGLLGESLQATQIAGAALIIGAVAAAALPEKRQGPGLGGAEAPGP